MPFMSLERQGGGLGHKGLKEELKLAEAARPVSSNSVSPPVEKARGSSGEDSEGSGKGGAHSGEKRRSCESDEGVGAASPGDEPVTKPPGTPPKKKRQGKREEEIEVPEDGYLWRKYGQKPLMDTPYNRAYYSCINKQAGCPAKKTVDRRNNDPSYIRVLYEGKHTHAPPPARAPKEVIIYRTSAPMNAPGSSQRKLHSPPKGSPVSSPRMAPSGQSGVLGRGQSGGADEGEVGSARSARSFLQAREQRVVSRPPFVKVEQTLPYSLQQDTGFKFPHGIPSPLQQSRQGPSPLAGSPSDSMATWQQRGAPTGPSTMSVKSESGVTSAGPDGPMTAPWLGGPYSLPMFPGTQANRGSAPQAAQRVQQLPPPSQAQIQAWFQAQMQAHHQLQVNNPAAGQPGNPALQQAQGLPILLQQAVLKSHLRNSISGRGKIEKQPSLPRDSSITELAGNLFGAEGQPFMSWDELVGQPGGRAGLGDSFGEMQALFDEVDSASASRLMPTQGAWEPSLAVNQVPAQTRPFGQAGEPSLPQIQPFIAQPYGLHASASALQQSTTEVQEGLLHSQTAAGTPGTASSSAGQLQGVYPHLAALDLDIDDEALLTLDPLDPSQQQWWSSN